MIWDCIYIKEFKIDSIKISNYKALEGLHIGKKSSKCAILTDTDTGKEYCVKISKSNYKQYSKKIQEVSNGNGDNYIQYMIFKKGSEYRHEVGFADQYMYAQFNALNDNERTIYKYNLDNIKNKCVEYELQKTRRVYKSSLIASCLMAMYFLTVFTGN